MFRALIRLLALLNRGIDGLIDSIKWAGSDSKTSATLIIFINLLRAAVPLLRWAVISMIGKPHIIVAAYTAWKLHLYVGLFVLVIGEISQYMFWPYKYWNIGWMFKRTFPVRYHEAMKKHAVSDTVDQHRERFTCPLVGWPKISRTKINLTIRPAIGRSLTDLKKIVVPLAAGYDQIHRINPGDNIPTASKGQISLLISNSTSTKVHKNDNPNLEEMEYNNA